MAGRSAGASRHSIGYMQRRSCHVLAARPIASIGDGRSDERGSRSPDAELADFAKAVPDLTILLNHLGGLTRVGPYGSRDDEVLATWRSGIAAVAACPNVNLKLGGIGMPRLGFDGIPVRSRSARKNWPHRWLRS